MIVLLPASVVCPSSYAFVTCLILFVEQKLEKNEEAALLSWELYSKENYLQQQQCQQKQNTEQKIHNIANR